MIKFTPGNSIGIIDFYDKELGQSFPVKYDRGKLRRNIEMMINALVVESVFEFLSDEEYYMITGGKENEFAQQVTVRLRDKRRIFNSYKNVGDFINNEVTLVWDSFEEKEKIMPLSKVIYENIEYEIEGYFIAEIVETHKVGDKKGYNIFKKNRRLVKSAVMKDEFKNIKMRLNLLTKSRFERLIGEEQRESLENLKNIEYKKNYEYDWLLYYKPSFFVGLEEEINWEYSVTIDKLIKLISGLNYKKRLIVNTSMVKEIEIDEHGVWTTGLSIMSGIDMKVVLKNALMLEKLYRYKPEPTYYDFMVYISQPFYKPGTSKKKPYMLYGFQLMENSFINMPRSFIKKHFKKVDEDRNINLSEELIFAEMTEKEVKKLLEK